MHQDDARRFLRQRRVEPPHVVDKVTEFAGELHTRSAAADYRKRKFPRRRLIAGSRGPLEALTYCFPQPSGVLAILQRKATLSCSRHAGIRSSGSDGDDQCVEASGGTTCYIHRATPGHATMMRLPVWLNVEFNDVRAVNSSAMTWYATIAIKGRPHDGTLASFTRIRLSAHAAAPNPFCCTAR